MKKFSFKAILLAMCFATSLTVSAEEKELEVSLGADLVSSYVWRGTQLGAASIQPSMSISYAGLTLGTWGSYDVFGLAPELDFYLGYEIAGFYIGATTYYNSGEFFDWKSSASTKLLEGNLSYTLPEAFPLTISANTMLFGTADQKVVGVDAKQNFSTYAELSYPFQIKSVEMSAAVGAVINESGYYGVDGFGVTNISLGASKEVKISDEYGIGLSAKTILNPCTEDFFLVLGITF